MQRQIDGFIPGVVAAVAEEELGGVEAADGIADVVANGDQLGFGGGGHAIISCSRMRP
jgi:hypothetical protein